MKNTNSKLSVPIQSTLHQTFQSVADYHNLRKHMLVCILSLQDDFFLDIM